MNTGGRWNRFVAALPMRVALLAVAGVWLMGCIWSYEEQAAFAAARGFLFPALLPLVIDGLAVSMAAVAWAASLDARPAIPARLATLIAVAASASSNGIWAYQRTVQDVIATVVAVAVPVAANLAFEVLLAELRRQVQRRRGLPPPVAVPQPRLIRLALAPWSTFRVWRRLVLELTALESVNGPPEALPTPPSRPALESLPSPERSPSPPKARTEPVRKSRKRVAGHRSTTGPELVEKVRVFKAENPDAGRPTIAREFNISDYQARQLLAHATNGHAK